MRGGWRTPAPPGTGKSRWGNCRRPRSPTRGGKTPPPIGLVHHPAQKQVTDVDEEQHGRRGQSRVPRPPRAPGRLAPDGAGYDGAAREEDAGLGRGAREAVPAQAAREEIPEAAPEDPRVSEVRPEHGRALQV